MKIQVNTGFSLEQPISVVVDGLCNHYDTSFEAETQDNYNEAHEFTHTSEYLVETCNKCKSYRTVFNDYPPNEWQGIQVMPL